MTSDVGKPAEKGHSRRFWKECQSAHFPGCDITTRKRGCPVALASHQMGHALGEIYTQAQGGFAWASTARLTLMGKLWKEHQYLISNEKCIPWYTMCLLEEREMKMFHRTRPPKTQCAAETQAEEHDIRCFLKTVLQEHEDMNL